MAETNTFTVRALLVELDRVIEQRRRIYAGLVAISKLRQSAADRRLGARRMGDRRATVRATLNVAVDHPQIASNGRSTRPEQCLCDNP